MLPQGHVRLLRAMARLSISRAGAGARLARLRPHSTQAAAPSMHLFNSLSGCVQPVPSPPPGVPLRVYVCGPTVYARSHVGHGRTYVVLHSLLHAIDRMRGCPCLHVRGVTDVDDKIVAAAGEAGVTPRCLARRYEADFNAEMDALGVARPTVAPRVSEHVDVVVDFIAGLMQRGHAYATRSGVYMDLKSLKGTPAEYGKLMPRGRGGEEEGEEAGAAHEDKRHARDFALWKRAPVGVQPSEEHCVWASPWGAGRPGWHIECSAMSALHAGSRIHIAAGGIDLAFPHHCNTIAQCEAATGVSPWADMHVHTGHVYIAGRKMSKSLKNFIPVADVLARRDGALCFRVFCLQYHYRSNVTYSEERLVEAHAHVTKLRECLTVVTLEGAAGQRVATHTRWTAGSMAAYSSACEALHTIRLALCDDFDTPRALKVLLGMCDALAGEVRAQAVPETFLIAARSLIMQGLDLLALKGLMDASPQQASVPAGDDNSRALLLTLRDAARVNAVSIARACKQRTSDGERLSADAAAAILKECDVVRDALGAATGAAVRDAPAAASKSK